MSTATVALEIQTNPPLQIQDIPLPKNISVQSAMEAAYDRAQYSFVIQWFGAGLGYEAVNLNGQPSSPSTGEYWFLFLRDATGEQETSGGMDETNVRSGDTIVWKFLHYSALKSEKAKGRAQIRHAHAVDLQ